MQTNEINMRDGSPVRLDQLLAVLRRRSPWVLLCFVVIAGASFGLSRSQTKKYTATAALVFSNTNLAESVAGISTVPPNSTTQSVQDTNVALARIGDMAARTATQLGGGLTQGEVKDSLSIAAQTDTNVVNIAATSTSPARAAKIANTYSTVFVNEQENTNHQYFSAALSTIERQLAALSPRDRVGAEGLALTDRAQSLATLAELPTGTVRIASVASIPNSPSSPHVTKDTIIGALLGLIVGLGVAFFLERFDRLIREPKDLEALYALPLLGVVPHSPSLARTSPRHGGTRVLPARELEAFHFIRAHLRYFGVDRRLRTLLIASAGSGDGKTTVASHLAGAAALMGARVLLIEADLRRPTVAQQIGLSAGPGLADVLIGATSLDEATQFVESADASADTPVGQPLAVLVAGATNPPNPAELLDSEAMENLLAEAAITYDQVIIDTAPLTAVSDTFALLGKVDGIIIVGRLDYDRRDVAVRLHQTLAEGGSHLLGVIANGLKTRRHGVYGYDDTYASQAEPMPSRP